MPIDRVKVRRLREQRVLTQAELAEEAGIGLLSVHKIEAGKQEPRPATIRKLAKALGVKPGDLITSNGPER